MNKVVVSTERIGPERARVLLGGNRHNRHHDTARSDRLAGAMVRGEWKLNGEALKFNGTGTLLDGQHRLWAIVKSGTEQDFVVVRGLETSVQETIDTGKARTIGDMLTLRGEKNANNLAAAARIVWAYQQTGIPLVVGKTGNPTPQQVLTLLDEHPALRASTHFALLGSNRGPLTVSHVAGLHYLFATVDSEDAAMFFARLADGDGLTRGNALFALRDRLVRESLLPHTRLVPLVRVAFTIRAWEAWRSGTEVTRLQWKAGGSRPDRFPRITDCGVEVQSA